VREVLAGEGWGVALVGLLLFGWPVLRGGSVPGGFSVAPFGAVGVPVFGCLSCGV